MKRYKHSFANYPLDFRGCVVSPTKICLQFSDPQIKLRVDSDTRSELRKLPNGDKYLEVPEHGVEITTTAVGCQMPVVEKYQLELIAAYKKYYRLHSETYKNTYDKSFKLFILTLYSKIAQLLDEIEKDGEKESPVEINTVPDKDHDDKYNDPFCTD